MNQKVKKGITLIAAASVLMGVSGCVKKEHEPNEKRGTNYVYDFIDYVNITAYGPDGEGIIEVSPKSYTTYDFDSEEEYIKVKKLMDSLNLVYIPGEVDKTSQVSISKTSGLSNGDVITVGLIPKAKYDLGDLSMNLEDYEYTVTTLTEGQDIDLFSDDAVLFYGLAGTKVVGAYNTADTSSFPEEIGENIGYSAQLLNSNESSLREKATVIVADANMDQDFLDKYNYHNLDIYMKKHGYSYKPSVETTLDIVIEPIEFDAEIRTDAENALADYFFGQTAETYSQIYTIDRIGNIQQPISAKDDKKFTYTVTFHAVSDSGAEMAFSSTMKIVNLAGRIVIMDPTNLTYCELSKLYEPINNTYTLLAQYYYEDNNEVSNEYHKAGPATSAYSSVSSAKAVKQEEETPEPTEMLEELTEETGSDPEETPAAEENN